ncbi:hypothetical protein D027_3021B, partial [Vibrio parahaemolyticus 861]|jgi:hypothetical protein
LEN